MLVLHSHTTSENLIFSENINLNHENSNRIPTFCGSLLTILMIMSTLFMGFIFGKDLINKNKPMITQSTTFVDNSSLTIEKDYFLMFGMRSLRFQLIHKNIISNLSVEGKIHYLENAIAFPSESVEMKFTDCRDSDLKKDY